MSLPLPVLDSRTFAQLVAEGTAQLPRLAPDWTDYNASDPGITLLELFAWLSEQNLYRTDRVPDEMVRAFLRLAGIAPLPPQVARTVLLLATSGPAISLPDRVQISGAGVTVTFETTGTVTVSPATLVQVLAGGDAPADVTADNARPFDAASDPLAGTFLPFGAAPQPGNALYLGFDTALGAAGTPVALHVWTTTPVQDDATRAALIAEWQAEKDAAARDCPPALAACLPDWRRHYSVTTAWEFHGADGAWHPLPDAEDETRALTLTGFVRFTVPAAHAPGGPGAPWFIRCRLVRGAYECPPRLDLVGINAVQAEHAASIAGPELLGVSAGHAWESYATASNPVVAGSTRLTLCKGTQTDKEWSETLNWDLTGPHDRHYRLEPERGRIVSGNGMRGAVLPAGWQVLCNYRVGGGAAGNVAPGMLTLLASTAWNTALIPGFAAVAAALSISQPIAASGGVAEEALPSAEARAVAALSKPTRAVTLADAAALTCAVPGVPVARAAAFPNMHPAVPCFTADGCVTLVVVPDCPGPAPMPTEGMLDAVARYLRPRRPVTTELHVIAPTYVTITVAATLQAATASDAALLPARAQAALDRLFSPLSGGASGAGWPIGRSVYRTEIMAALAALAGVLTVADLSLQAGDATPVCGNIALCDTDLVRSGTHAIVATVAGTATFSRSRERECS